MVILCSLLSTKCIVVVDHLEVIDADLQTEDVGLLQGEDAAAEGDIVDRQAIVVVAVQEGETVDADLQTEDVDHPEVEDVADREGLAAVVAVVEAVDIAGDVTSRQSCCSTDNI